MKRKRGGPDERVVKNTGDTEMAPSTSSRSTTTTTRPQQSQAVGVAKKKNKKRRSSTNQEQQKKEEKKVEKLGNKKRKMDSGGGGAGGLEEEDSPPDSDNDSSTLSSSSADSSSRGDEGEKEGGEKVGGANPTTLAFDFEALPPAAEDTEGIVALLAQIFPHCQQQGALPPQPPQHHQNKKASGSSGGDGGSSAASGDDDGGLLRGLAQRVVEQSPLGCVFRELEGEEEDEKEGRSDGEGGQSVEATAKKNNIAADDGEGSGSKEDGGEEPAESDLPVYGVTSVVELGGGEKFQLALANHLIEKAKKHGGKAFRHHLETLLRYPPHNKRNVVEKEGAQQQSQPPKVGLLISERMLHFPAEIAGPAYRALMEDLDEESTTNSGSAGEGNSNQQQRQPHYHYLLMVVKLRMTGGGDMGGGGSGSKGGKKVGPTTAGKKGRRKLGKAARKRLAAEATAEAERAGDVIFDNPEEELLFQQQHESQVAGSGSLASTTSPPPLSYFDYPVQSEVADRDSEFHSSVVDGRLYRAYRRVVLMSMGEFRAFAQRVGQLYS